MATKIYKLKGKVQHYQWGGYHFLPELLNLPVDQEKPCAEYWLGAHDNASAELVDHPALPLNKFISAHPEVLGDQVRSTFGRLPYLLKVLDVKDMLSIQVHPSKEAAKKEFENENKKGIPLDAPHRNYKDDNHKPELMLALSDFWLLHGFRSEEQIIQITQAIPEFKFMLPLMEEGGIPLLYQSLMALGQDQVNRILSPLLQRIKPAYENGKLAKDDPHFWAARAGITFNALERTDRGIFSIYLLNLVHLKKGEAIFQDAGVLHAYLEGQNMEIMANSDNVLRGGLTPKHIDVNELMKHVRFEPIVPGIIHGRLRGMEEVFETPVSDFELSRLPLTSGQHAAIETATVDIFFLMQGTVSITANNGTALHLNKGEAAVSTAGASLSIKPVEEAVIFRASVPVE